LGVINLPDIEAALAAEAAAHARAALDLNPFLEAEAVELGRARLVYAGTFSPVHGAYALGLDGPLEERDWQEIHRFFQRKEREANFWLAPFTDPSVAEALGARYRAGPATKVIGITLGPSPGGNFPDGVSNPEHGAWALTFSRRENPARNEPDLLAMTKVHQRETRFYLLGDEAASYTFFHQGLAIIPYPDERLLPLQKREAEEFKCSALICLGDSSLPLLYERTLHEPV
jgi:hypothetical protein